MLLLTASWPKAACPTVITSQESLRPEMHPLEGRVCSLTFVFVSGHQQSGSYKAAVGVSAVRWRLRKRVNQMREQRRSQWLQRRMNERKKRKEDGWRRKMKDGEAWLICLCCEIAGFPRSANCGSEFFPQLVCLYLFLCTHTPFSSRLWDSHQVSATEGRIKDLFIL